MSIAKTLDAPTAGDLESQLTYLEPRLISAVKDMQDLAGKLSFINGRLESIGETVREMKEAGMFPNQLMADIERIEAQAFTGIVHVCEACGSVADTIKKISAMKNS